MAKKEEKKKKGDKPVIKFRSGTVNVSVFKHLNKNKDGEKFESFSVVPQMSYMDDDGEFQEKSSLDVGQLPKMIVCLQKAYEYVACKVDEGKEEADEDED